MKTLAQLKRDAKAGNIETRMTYRYGEEIPERLQGWRKLVNSNSVAIFFRNADGKESELRIRTAALVDYDENALTVYGIGQRELTDEERAALYEWEAIEAGLTMWDSGYWKKKDFFEKRGMEHLEGFEFVRGLKYDRNTGKVYDMQVRGDVELRYELRTAA